MSDKNNNYNGGLGFSSVLTLIFVVLKLVGVIDWSWLWVFSPTWIELIIFAIILIALVIYNTNLDSKWSKK